MTEPTGEIVHIAGPDIQVNNLLRQRCGWCGALLLDYDLDRVAVPVGTDPRPLQRDLRRPTVSHPIPDPRTIPAGTIYVRTGGGDPPPRFGPKGADHPTVGQPCPACRVLFAAGDWTTLVTLGPGDDPEARERARVGRIYNAVAIEAHWACVTGEEVDE